MKSTYPRLWFCTVWMTAILLWTGCTAAPEPPSSAAPPARARTETAEPEQSPSIAPRAAPPAPSVSVTAAPPPSPTPAPVLRSVSFDTELPPSTENRVNNLTVVAKKLNGAVIPAGEDFSFNKSVGPRTVKAGYRKATIFVNKKKVQEVGGGICQMSTTLYNAALLMELPIVERHEHSLEVPYIEKGKDATISYNSMDLVFKNDTDKDIVISAAVDSEKVHVTLTEKIAA